MENKEKIRIKILMLGDSGVGKSSMLTRFSEGLFSKNLVGTTGIDFRMKKIVLDNKEYFLEMWDTAG